VLSTAGFNVHHAVTVLWIAMILHICGTLSKPNYSTGTLVPIFNITSVYSSILVDVFFNKFLLQYST
jgi:hypothetical protein